MSLPILCIFLVFFVCNSGGIIRCANGQAPGQGSWCVAKPSSSDVELDENINYACNYVNCSIIQEGGLCFHPDNKNSHASVVMNLYYQKEGRHFWNCDFNKSALLVVIDPSYGDCKYEFAK